MGIVLIAAGFMLEKVKVSLNFVIEYSAKIPDYNEMDALEREACVESFRRNNPSDYFHSHEPFEYFFRLKSDELIWVKWRIAIIALLVFCALNTISVWLILVDHVALRWLMFIYFLIILMAALFFFFEWFFGSDTGALAVARKILAAGQSGIPAILILLIFKLKLQSTYVDGLE
jgi:hypothetical protein